MGKQARYNAGRKLRLEREVRRVIHNFPVNYSCVYRRIEQAAQFKRGWNSVTEIDINVAVAKELGHECMFHQRTNYLLKQSELSHE